MERLDSVVTMGQLPMQISTLPKGLLSMEGGTSISPTSKTAAFAECHSILASFPQSLVMARQESAVMAGQLPVQALIRRRVSLLRALATFSLLIGLMFGGWCSAQALSLPLWAMGHGASAAMADRRSMPF